MTMYICSAHDSSLWILVCSTLRQSGNAGLKESTKKIYRWIVRLQTLFLISPSFESVEV